MMQQRSNGIITLITAALISAAASTTQAADNDPAELYYLMTNSTPGVLEDKVVKKFSIINGKFCFDKEAAGKSFCEALAKTYYPDATSISCDARNVEMDENCAITSVDCSCSVTY